MLLTPTKIVGENWAILLVDLNEGFNGDYNPDDPEDVHLWRIEVERKGGQGEWYAPDDSSYCTHLPVSTDKHTVKSCLIYAFTELLLGIEAGVYPKRVYERLSWIDPSWAVRKAPQIDWPKEVKE